MANQLAPVARVGRRRSARAAVEPFNGVAAGTPVLESHRRMALILRSAHPRRVRSPREPRSRRMRIRRIGGRGLAVPVAVAIAAGNAGSAWGATTVNTTIHVPASVATTPCVPGDFINLNGDIHIVQTATADVSGGFHVATDINSQFSGTSLVTGVGYVNAQTQEEDWYAGTPFPAVHTSIHDLELVSKSATANYVLRAELHQTVTAAGVPAATVDNFSMDCKG
jgi:hypothetical protein